MSCRCVELVCQDLVGLLVAAVTQVVWKNSIKLIVRILGGYKGNWKGKNRHLNNSAGVFEIRGVEKVLWGMMMGPPEPW